MVDGATLKSLDPAPRVTPGTESTRVAPAKQAPQRPESEASVAKVEQAQPPDKVSAVEETEETTVALKTFVDGINDVLNVANNTRLQFKTHQGTGRTVIRIVEKDTGEVIKEFPPEALLDMAEKLNEMAGLLVDREQ